MTADEAELATSPRSRSSSRACTETSRPPVGSSMNRSRGPRDQVAGDLQPLLHAAGEGRRQVVDAVPVDLDPAEPVARRLARIVP